MRRFLPLCQFRRCRASRDAAGQDGRSQESPFQCAFSVDAGKTRQFTHGVQSGDGLTRDIDDTAGLINGDAAHAFARQRHEAQGVKWRLFDSGGMRPD